MRDEDVVRRIIGNVAFLRVSCRGTVSAERDGEKNLSDVGNLGAAVIVQCSGTHVVRPGTGARVCTA